VKITLHAATGGWIGILTAENLGEFLMIHAALHGGRPAPGSTA
jgi:hypothetical protein